MKRLRPMAWIIIIVNVFWLYRLFTELAIEAGNPAEQVGNLIGYMMAAITSSVILYIIFRITEKRK